MAAKIQGLSGTRDFYPPQMRFRTWLFDKLRHVSELYGYEEYDGPMLEAYDLYAGKSGAELVNDQMYNFTHMGGERMAVRPEITPTLARMVAVKQQELRKPVRWYSIPVLWRHERKQRGRLREFWQYNIDILGVDGVDAELEIMSVVVDIFKALGLSESDVVLRVSNRHYLESLLQSLAIDLSLKDTVYQQIDRFEKMPIETFRANLTNAGLNEAQIAGLEAAFRDKDYSSFAPLVNLFARAEQYGIRPYLSFDPLIVRGLLYYTGTVFEAWARTPTFNRAIMGGGRYDNLVANYGGQPMSAVGIAVSDVVLEELLRDTGKLEAVQASLRYSVDVYVAQLTINERKAAADITRRLRTQGLKAVMNVIEQKLDKQLKAASADNANYAIIIGPDELAKGVVQVKDLRQRQQFELALADLDDFQAAVQRHTTAA